MIFNFFGELYICYAAKLTFRLFACRKNVLRANEIFMQERIRSRILELPEMLFIQTKL
jgi:hypothetical protein